MGDMLYKITRDGEKGRPEVIRKDAGWSDTALRAVAPAGRPASDQPTT
jgi:hypothetical protein